MRYKIEKYVADNNLIFGVCNAKKLIHIKDALENKKVPFVDMDIEYRIDPKLTLYSAKSIIVVGMNYNKKAVVEKDNKLRANISIGAIGIDYHIKLNSHLNNIINILKDSSAIEYKSFVDTGPLVERELAKKAGLGWEGKNGNIISHKFGSFFFIGYIITNLDLGVSTAYESDISLCGNCKKCVEACPSNTLYDTNNRDYFKCVSYLTQCKGILNDDEYSLIGNSIYGCDICQIVCPHNKNTYFDIVEDVKNPEIEKFLNLTKKEFQDMYGNTAMAWRGINTLKRNAIICLANSKDKRAIGILEKYLSSSSEIIRHAANKAYNELK